MTDETTPPPGVGGPDPGSTATVPPPAATTPSRPVFRRSSNDKVLGGVSGGLARTFDLDPVVVRIITVVVALVFPPALVAYLAAWLLVARDDEPSRPPTGGIAFRESGGIAFWIGVVLLAGALLAALDNPFNGGFGLVPLVLIGIGIALWTRDGNRATNTGTPPTTWPSTHPTTGAAMPATTTGPAAPADGAQTPPPARPPTNQPPAPAPPPAAPPPPPQPRSPLGAVTIGLSLVATGVVAALDQIDGVPIDADLGHLAAVALLVLGLGQLVGALWGRARWLSIVAVFLLPPVIFGAVIREVDGTLDLDLEGVQLGSGIGQRVYVVDGTQDLPTDLDLAAGEIDLDLTDWRPGAEAREDLDSDQDVTVDVGAGEVTVSMPTDVPWRLVGEVRVGEVRITNPGDGTTSRDTESDGIPVDVELTGGPRDGEVLDVVVDVRFGQLNIITNDDNAKELS